MNINNNNTNTNTNNKNNNADTPAARNDLSVIGRVVVIVPEFRQWSGTRAMKEQDFHVGTNGQLPPKEVTRSLGLKAIIDTKALNVFDRLRHRADAILESCGVRYLSGFAIPESRADDVIRQLDAVVADYENEKASFLNRYDALIEEWAKAHPEFEREILDSKLDKNSVAERISAGYEPFRLQPINDEKAGALAQSISGLSNELIASVAQDARTFFKESFLNRNRANRKTVNAVIRIRERLSGLSFLNSSIQPIITMIDQVVSAMPSEGYFSGEAFWKLAALIQTLGDEKLLSDIIRGKQTVDGLSAEGSSPVFQPADAEAESEAEADAASAKVCRKPFSPAETADTSGFSAAESAVNTEDAPTLFADLSEPPAAESAPGAKLSDIDRFFEDGDEDASPRAAALPARSEAVSSPEASSEASADMTPPALFAASAAVMSAVDIGEGFYF